MLLNYDTFVLQIWERLHGGLDERRGRTTFCASGLHPDGTCSCETVLISEESSSRTSISRIVMLAEALFEVTSLLLNKGFDFLFLAY